MAYPPFSGASVPPFEAGGIRKRMVQDSNTSRRSIFQIRREQTSVFREVSTASCAKPANRDRSSGHDVGVLEALPHRRSQTCFRSRIASISADAILPLFCTK